MAQVFGWDRVLLEGRTKQSRLWRDQVDTWWATRLNMPNLTPRLMLQLWGTEVCRRGFHDDIWIASLENKLRKITDNVVISDCRFPNEIDSIRNSGGIVVRVKRGPDPEWYNDAMQYNRGEVANMAWALSRAKLDNLNVHASESAWVGTNFDYVLDNNATLDHLYQQINDLLQDHQVSREDQAEQSRLHS